MVYLLIRKKDRKKEAKEKNYGKKTVIEERKDVDV